MKNEAGEGKAHPQRVCDGQEWTRHPNATIMRRVFGQLLGFCTEDCWRAFVRAEFSGRKKESGK